MFGERGGDFNCNTKEHHSNSLKNPQRAGHTMSGITWRLWFTLLYKRDVSFRISVITEKVFWKGAGDY
jgi:hypothetical protein